MGDIHTVRKSYAKCRSRDVGKSATNKNKKAAKKQLDVAAVLFGLKFAIDIHYKFNS